MHNAENSHPPASVGDTGGQGELWASPTTRARNSLRAVAARRAPTGGSSWGVGGTSAAKKVAPGSAGHGDNEVTNIIVDTRPDVPLGFYEPIIATDPQGHKSLFGWRYVGFMPFSGCPVNPCIDPNVVYCDPSQLWGIVATPNSIKFDRLSDMENRYVKGGKWPYKYKQVDSMDALNIDNHDSPPPATTPAPPDGSIHTDTGASDVSDTSDPKPSLTLPPSQEAAPGGSPQPPPLSNRSPFR